MQYTNKIILIRKDYPKDFTMNMREKIRTFAEEHNIDVVEE